MIDSTLGVFPAGRSLTDFVVASVIRSSQGGGKDGRCRRVAIAPDRPGDGQQSDLSSTSHVPTRPYDARWAILSLFSPACPPGALTESREFNSSSESGLYGVCWGSNTTLSRLQ